MLGPVHKGNKQCLLALGLQLTELPMEASWLAKQLSIRLGFSIYQKLATCIPCYSEPLSSSSS